jgi:hypothetical protein
VPDRETPDQVGLDGQTRKERRTKEWKTKIWDRNEPTWEYQSG